MIFFIYGGSNSGKSDYAENICCDFIGEKIYLATMTAQDEESLQRITKHKKSRKNKGFVTIEKGSNFSDFTHNTDIILLECVGNWLANEMFSNNLYEIYEHDNDYIFEKLTNDLYHLKNKCKHLVVVSNDIFREKFPDNLDKFTLNYIDNMANLHSFLGMESDCVIELVYGIPIVHKNEVNYEFY